MTSVSALLAWLDPSPTLLTSALPGDQIVRMARHAVVDGVVVELGRWNTVEVVPKPAAPLLAATAGAEQGHFHVFGDGRVRPSLRWEAQQPVPHSSPGTIRILVHAPEREDTATAAQCLCVRALMTTLAQSLHGGLGPGVPEIPPLRRTIVFPLMQNSRL